MRITNNHNLPESVLNALHRPTYTKGDAHISCTELLNSPRIVQLKRKHWDDVEQDASESDLQAVQRRKSCYASQVTIPVGGAAMSTLPVSAHSAWDADGISAFLQSAIIPMRLAVNDSSGFPRLCSLWFMLDGNTIVAASHEKALISRLLQLDNRCAFEIATNTEPYRGVRGQARVRLAAGEGAQVLPRLISKYIGSRHPRLQQWLMSRVQEELVLRLELEWISAWDYSGRMVDVKVNEHAV